MSNLKCEWSEEDLDGSYWQTDCGEAFVLNDGPPSENKMRYCCYCGRTLVEVPYKLAQQDDEEGRDGQV